LDHKQRDTKDEIPFARLVPEGEHAGIDADASEGGRHEEEEAFGNPFRAVLPRPDLVQKHNEEGRQVHEQKESGCGNKLVVHKSIFGYIPINILNPMRKYSFQLFQMRLFPGRMSGTLDRMQFLLTRQGVE
jgi:hypothetical protein